MTLESVQLFWGDAHTAEARVYAQLPRDGLPDDVTLRGRVVGPTCAHAHSLTAVSQLVDRGPGDTLLCEAIVSDPCFWTPELPYLYRVEIELVVAGESVERTERRLGIRPLGRRGKRLIYDSRPWVARGVDRDHVAQGELTAWREHEAVVVCVSADDTLLRQADEQGYLLAVRLNEPCQLAEPIARLARHPAVGFVVLDSCAPLDVAMRRAARNLLFVERLAESAAVPQPWADVVLIERDDPAEIIERAADFRLPVIAGRLNHDPRPFVEARRGCDRLQAELAGHGEFAGYWV